MASKELRPGSIRVRLAVLGSFGKWTVKHSRLAKNPMEVITLPAKRSRTRSVPKWEAVEQFIARCSRHRDKAMLALMVYGGLRRAEVVRLNIGDYQPQFGLRRVPGKGGHESTVPLPEVARIIVNEYLAKEGAGASTSEPLFQVQYRWYGGESSYSSAPAAASARCRGISGTPTSRRRRSTRGWRRRICRRS